jgi:hypothetical protein
VIISLQCEKYVHQQIIVSISYEFEDTKRIISIRKSVKNRQHNDQSKKDKSTNNDLQNIHIQLKIELSEPH